MAELTVKFKTSGFSSAARSLGRSFDTRYNDYQGIRKKVLNETTSRSYLSSSGSYLQKKMDSLDSKRDKLDGFKRQVEGFCDEAKRADKGVANRIKGDAKDVYKTLGIKTGFWAVTASFFKGAGKAIWKGLNDAWGAIKSTCKTVKEAIIEWYEKNKEWLDKVIKVVLAVGVAIAVVITIVASVMTFGAFATLAVFALGALIGMSGQLANDIISGVINGKFEFSSWETYLGKAIGGGVGLLVTALSCGTLGSVTSGFLSTTIGQSLEKATGRKDRSWGEIFLNVGEDMALEYVLSKAFKIDGLDKGRGSYSAIKKQIVTKITRGQIKNISNKTIGKLIILQVVKTSKKRLIKELKHTIFSGDASNFKQLIKNTFYFTKPSPPLIPLYNPIKI